MLGCLLLMLATPLMVIAAIGIVLVTGGSPIFAQERVGQNGRRFKIFKLRTMVKNAHDLREQLKPLNEVGGPVFKIRKDPRLHPLGGLLRRTSIDELPNLINVLLGEMSLVGPRPPLPSEVEHYDSAAPRRLASARRDLPVADKWAQRRFIRALDGARQSYVGTWTPLGDLAIIANTIPAVSSREGAH